jgi:hypothetical protein
VTTALSPARGEPLAGVRELLRQHVERGHHAIAVEEEQRPRSQGGVVPGLEVGLALRRPGLPLERDHLPPELDGDLGLGVGGESHRESFARTLPRPRRPQTVR